MSSFHSVRAWRVATKRARKPLIRDAPPLSRAAVAGVATVELVGGTDTLKDLTQEVAASKLGTGVKFATAFACLYHWAGNLRHAVRPPCARALCLFMVGDLGERSEELRASRLLGRFVAWLMAW